MSRPLSMTDAAAEVGLSYERFRKVWRGMCQDQGFPAPFLGRSWDREAVAAWKLARGARRIVTDLQPKPEPEVRGANARAQRARASLQQLRAG